MRRITGSYFFTWRGGMGGLSVFTCTRDVEAFLKKTAIAYHLNPRKGAEFGGMQWKPFLKTLRRRKYCTAPAILVTHQINRSYGGRLIPQSLPTTESELWKILRFENGRHVKTRWNQPPLGRGREIPAKHSPRLRPNRKVRNKRNTVEFRK